MKLTGASLARRLGTTFRGQRLGNDIDIRQSDLLQRVNHGGKSTEGDRLVTTNKDWLIPRAAQLIDNRSTELMNVHGIVPHVIF
jgi:hypothetical protein